MENSKRINKYNHQVRNLIPLNDNDFIALNGMTPKELVTLIKSYNDALLFCIENIDSQYSS